MALGRRQLFIYWRVATQDVADAMQAVRGLQLGLARQHPGLACGLYRRSDAAAVEATLMETYAVDAQTSAAGIEPALQRHIEGAGAAALRTWQRGARHVEVFEACTG